MVPEEYRDEEAAEYYRQKRKGDIMEKGLCHECGGDGEFYHGSPTSPYTCDRCNGTGRILKEKNDESKDKK